MWRATVRVSCEQKIDAAAEKVWELAGSPAALSAMSGRGFAFPVPGTGPGTGRLCCLIVAGPHAVRCYVLEVQREVPRRSITWQVRPVQAGTQTLTLSVRPRSRGCTLGVAVGQAAGREPKAAETAVRQTASGWADRIKAIAEGREPWPPAGLPPGIQAVCAGRPLPGETGQATGTVLIHAPADAVWQMVWAPEISRFMDPERVAWAGHVPGTPRRAVGEMQCVVTRHSGDRFGATLVVVKELTEGRRAVTQRIASPDTELVHLLTSVPRGTRLQLTTRWAAGAASGKTDPGTLPDAAARHMQEQAEGYKALIEKAAGA